MQKLTEHEITHALAALPKWKLDSGEIVREFTFDDFAAAMAFVNAVAAHAETANHHPDIDIRYNRVRLALLTHDSRGLTRKDFALAATLDAIQN